jgi:ABC-type molybdate transport system permease subunit
MDMSPLWISLKTSLSATFLAFILGVTAAKLMSGYRGRLKSVLDGVLILPLVLPPNGGGISFAGFVRQARSPGTALIFTGYYGNF